ncbi:zinc finger protein OZF-like [Sitodiplosis mosellana]|uniref:zinc finger protein OZF-like n=1 Tax=Sitodiplosis mosellana TaxID=263140 RepID=UPI002443A9A5|nr:zinc finger protein OZF-like [Sitodiplosis mosellana]
MECFMCGSVHDADLSICNATTKYQKIPFTSILDNFIGSDCEIAIGHEDRICQMCKAIFDELDLLRYKLDNIENILTHKLHRKYKFDSTKELPAIRLDEQTAIGFVHGQNGHKFQCESCSFSTDFLDCLTPHSLMHQNEHTTADLQINEFSCKTCHLILLSEYSFEEHMRLFHSEGDDEKNLTSDLANVDGFNEDFEHGNQPTVECAKCAKTFDSHEEYVTHLLKAHYVCDKCNKKCKSAKTLMNHMKLRHMEHICDICGKELGSLVSYQAHVTLHSNKHKFNCSYCNKGFRAKSLLETHIVIHTPKEFNFTCHICGQNFIHQRSHRLHLKWHQNPRPYQCVQCEKSYKHSSHLAIHRRTHSGERPNACQFCDRRFISSSKLKSHLAIHTNIYLHSCSICGKGYSKRYKLAQHMLHIHDDNEMISNKPKCEYKLVVNPEFEALAQ